MTDNLPQGIVVSYEGRSPKIDGSVFLAPTACIIGDVQVDNDASIWFGAVLRGDEACIRVGSRTNVQDGVIVHSNTGQNVFIGNDVTVGHGAVVHGCKIEDCALVGMGAVVLDGAVIESGAIIAAGAVVGPGKRIPADTLWAGVPAAQVRELGDESRRRIIKGAEHYRRQAACYMQRQSGGRHLD